MRRTALLAVALTAVSPALVPPAADAAPARRIVHTSWSSRAAFEHGSLVGAQVRRGRLVLGAQRQARGRYDYGRWTSPWRAPGFALTELVADWEASTRGDSWLDVKVRGEDSDGRVSTWDTLARWAADDRTVARTTRGAQPDDLGRVSYDTWLTPGARRWQLRVVLHGRAGTRATPRVDRVGAMVSRLPAVSSVPTSAPGRARGVKLPVPRFSQMTHRGHFPRYGGGGEAWCSPTSTAMVLGYYGALPPRSHYRWVGAGHQDAVVDHLARTTYDEGLAGTGNWPFNTAYAASRTGHAFVTRLRSLRQAERFILAGIPLVASVAFDDGELDGAPISSTDGHLLVIAGFTKNGDVVVNDPAGADASGVRRTYDRGQLEDAWLSRGVDGGSGGLVYVIHDDAHPLPRGPARNW